MLLARHGWAVVTAASGRLGFGSLRGRESPFRAFQVSAFCTMESNDGSQYEPKCLAASTSESQYFARIVDAPSDFTEPGDRFPSTLDCCKQAEVSGERSVMSVSSETCQCESASVEIFHENKLKGEISGGLNCAADALLASNNDRHSMSIEVGSLARFVKGKWGFTQRSIEKEFGVKIIFPTSMKESSIVVEGVSSDSVTGASEKIKNMLEEVIKSGSLDYSHFVSLPLGVHEELVEKVTNFQNTILASCIEDRNTDSNSNEACNDNEDIKGLPEGADVIVKLDVQETQHTRFESDARSTNNLGIDKSIFLKPRQLHLTVLMLKLHSKDRIALAAEVLQKISPKVMDALDHRPLSIRLKGLACMRGSPAKAYVVHAPVEEMGREERLLRACQVVIDAYLEAGLALKEDAQRALKFHATLMNTRQRKRRGNERNRMSDPFDATYIFKKYGSTEWGEYPLQEMHLSQRFLYDDNGYYHCCGSIPLPGSIAS